MSAWPIAPPDTALAAAAAAPAASQPLALAREPIAPAPAPGGGPAHVHAAASQDAADGSMRPVAAVPASGIPSYMDIGTTAAALVEPSASLFPVANPALRIGAPRREFRPPADVLTEAREQIAETGAISFKDYSGLRRIKRKGVSRVDHRGPYAVPDQILRLDFVSEDIEQARIRKQLKQNRDEPSDRYPHNPFGAYPERNPREAAAGVATDVDKLPKRDSPMHAFNLAFVPDSLRKHVHQPAAKRPAAADAPPTAQAPDPSKSGAHKKPKKLPLPIDGDFAKAIEGLDPEDQLRVLAEWKQVLRAQVQVQLRAAAPEDSLLAAIKNNAALLDGLNLEQGNGEAVDLGTASGTSAALACNLAPMFMKFVVYRRLEKVCALADEVRAQMP